MGLKSSSCIEKCNGQERRSEEKKHLKTIDGDSWLKVGRVVETGLVASLF